VRKTSLAVAFAVAALVTVAAPAAAVPPQHFSVDQPPRVIQDAGQACGFPVRWTIDLEVEGTNFFDRDGRLVRQQAHVREDNTITNLATGLTLREGPDSFMQTIEFNPDGTIARIIATGLAANVQGDERLKDVGRVIWLPGTNEIVFSAGPHPVREAVEFGTLQSGLAAFCVVLS
jgi:hypothetical protein